MASCTVWSPPSNRLGFPIWNSKIPTLQACVDFQERRIMLRVVVLGAAAGGGVPQWNCGWPVCRMARSERPERQSTQASIAFSADSRHWFLVNASPDLRQQLTATPQLHPAAGELRHSPITGVIL